MKKILLALLLCAGVAFADPGVPPKEFDWPTTPTRFRCISIWVDLEWKDGRPYAARTDLVKMLHISPEGEPMVDLIEALDEKGWLVRRDHSGEIQAINPHGASVGRPLDPKTKEKNLAAPKPQPKPTTPPKPATPPKK